MLQTSDRRALIMKQKIIELAKKCGADVIGFAPSSRFDKNDNIFKIMPETKTVIGLGFQILRGIYRGVEAGSTYYQYTTMAVENMEETIMPMAQLRVAMMIEDEGYIALPQRKHQQIMAQANSTNPEVAYDAVYRNKHQEIQMDFLNAAVKCGLGERSFHNALLNDEFGPMIRYCFILTDAEIEGTDEYVNHLCDKCGKCAKACPGGAIADTGDVDVWQCTVYYNGANGTKNPFMPPDAFAKFENRLDIISGKIKVTPESARTILDNIYFYPPAQHAYQCSICGRACDMACYSHLEEKGVLKKKYNSKFKKQDDWHFDISSFE